ncbi:hypothetical protein BSKO_06159 [Bryopsis sp. KO-2023]|nr:hypothetical protein BSKO_06159 [Bryopsis sp. KO-2023]
MYYHDEEVPLHERKPLELAPRNEEKAKLKSPVRSSKKSNPFGDARPREEVLASRTGQSEMEILRHEAEQEHLRLRLTPQQENEKRQLEVEILEAEKMLAAARDEHTRLRLAKELHQRRQELEKLVEEFEKLAVEHVAAINATRSFERHHTFPTEGFDEHGPRHHHGRGGSGDFHHPMHGYGSNYPQSPPARNPFLEDFYDAAPGQPRARHYHSTDSQGHGFNMRPQFYHGQGHY